MSPWKRRTKLLVLAFGIFVALLAAMPLADWATLPRHNGRTIRSWWNDYLETQRAMFSRREPITPEQFERLRIREEQSAAAIQQMRGEAGKFLARQFNPNPWLSAYLSFHRRFVSQKRPWLARFLPAPEDPFLRAQAMQRLLSQNAEARAVAQQILISNLSQCEPETRAQLAWLVTGSRFTNSYPVEHVAACLRYREGRLAEWAASMLAEQGSNAIPFASDIRSAIRHRSIEPSSGARALHKIGAPLWTSLPSLNRELSRTNPAPIAALNLTAELGTNRVHLFPGLSNAVLHPDSRFAAMATKSVARLGEEGQGLGPALAQALESPWYFVRSESVNALEAVGGEALSAALPKIRALAGDAHPDVSNAVRRVLAKLDPAESVR